MQSDEVSEIPFKERKRHYDYQYNQTDRQEELALKHEMKKLMKEKFDAYCREQEYKTEKDIETEEVYKQIKAMAKGGVE